jgi:hypothetical protein
MAFFLGPWFQTFELPPYFLVAERAKYSPVASSEGCRLIYVFIKVSLNRFTCETVTPTMNYPLLGMNEVCSHICVSYFSIRRMISSTSFHIRCQFCSPLRLLQFFLIYV